MLQNLTGVHALVILALVVLIFGAAKLPALARSVGQSVKILKKEASTEGPAVGLDDAGSDVTATSHLAPVPAVGATAAPCSAEPTR